ncbi:MAG: hypothetical protein ACJAZP_003861 [Psychromonas sp.]
MSDEGETPHDPLYKLRGLIAMQTKKNSSAWDNIPESEKVYICKQGGLPKGVAYFPVREMSVRVLDQLYFTVMHLADCDISMLDALTVHDCV